MSKHYGINQTDPKVFQMFNSSKYNEFKDQMFMDSTVRLVDVGDKDTYEKWLGKRYQEDLKALRCPPPIRPTDDDKDIKGSASAISSLVVLVVSASVFTVLNTAEFF